MIEYIIKEDNGYNYVEIGEGAPLILLHGLFGALSNWQAVIENFSKSGIWNLIPQLSVCITKLYIDYGYGYTNYTYFFSIFIFPKIKLFYS